MAVERGADLTVGPWIPGGLHHLVEEASLPTAGELGQTAEGCTATPGDILELGCPAVPVEGQPDTFHPVEERACPHLERSDLLEADGTEAFAQDVGNPEGLDRVGCGVAALFGGEVVGGGERQLHGSLALGTDAEQVLGRPGETVVPTEPATALVQQGIGELGIPPPQVRCGVGATPDTGVEDAGVETRVPRVGAHTRQQRREQHGIDIACVDDERLLGAVGAAGGHRHDPQSAAGGAVDWDLGVDGDALGRPQRPVELGQLRRVVDQQERDGHRVAWTARPLVVAQLHPSSVAHHR